jgi:hypothetical protein
MKGLSKLRKHWIRVLTNVVRKAITIHQLTFPILYRIFKQILDTVEIV